jgi:hypothetical protein
MRTDSLCFLCVVFSSVCKILASLQLILWPALYESSANVVSEADLASNCIDAPYCILLKVCHIASVTFAAVSWNTVQAASSAGHL